MGELPVLDSPRRAARRGKLIVQSVLGDAGSGPYSPTTVEKTEAELALIMEAFANKPIFSKLQPNQLADVAAIMQRRSFAAGDELTTEGSAGDTFFIIYEGRCVVQRGRESTHELPTGESFGDIALIYNQPRTATITALTPVSTFTLDRTAYRNGVVAATKRQRAAREALLTTVPIIEKMSPLQVILPTASGVSNEGRSSPLLVPLPAVSWPWVPAWGSLEPPRRDGENAQ